jgi:alkylation response protein AidB-like acyl-CoA dehydrogenase
VDRPWVKLALAEAYALLQALKVMNWRLAWELERGIVDPSNASAAKVYGTESILEVYRLLLEIVGVAGTVEEHSPGAVLRGRLAREARGAQINTFGGGVNEIQREIVAMLGLGMPRPPR